MSTNQRHHPDDLVLGGLGLREGLGLQHLRDDGRLLLRVGNVASAPLLRHGAQQLRVALHQRTRLLATRPNLGTLVHLEGNDAISYWPDARFSNLSPMVL